MTAKFEMRIRADIGGNVWGYLKTQPEYLFGRAEDERGLSRSASRVVIYIATN
jgi:hypothetical protein